MGTLIFQSTNQPVALYCVAVMTSGGLLINQSLVSLVTPNQYAAAAAAGGFVANGPQPISLSVTVSRRRPSA